MKNTLSREILFGTAVGDALGVPVEFKPREYLVKNPVKEMIGYGTHHQPPGTWSDDSSLTFCLAESLCKDYNINDIAGNFVKWMDEGYWTPFGKVFDIGITTRKAIHNLKKGVEPALAGESDEYSNGNGSLMRILPLLPYIATLDFKEQFKIISEVSSITHRHPRSILGCILLLKYANQLQYESPIQSLWTLTMNFHNDIWEFPELENEMMHFKRFFDGMKIDEYNALEKAVPTAYKATSLMKATMPSISTIKVDEIKSSGYVVHTLEASIWCLINTTSFKDAVLMAVNLGDDTDTTGAVTGALAAIYYGYDAIPKEWINQLVGKDEIMTLANKMDKFVLYENFKHKCPVCGIPLKKNQRYPSYVCLRCMERATDDHGRKLDFFNLSISGGYGAEYEDTKEVYNSHKCFIDGIPCFADEARFGGIVVQVIDERSKESWDKNLLGLTSK